VERKSTRRVRFLKEPEEPFEINQSLRAIGSWTHYNGMSLALRLIEPFTDILSTAEKLILIVLLSTMVRGTGYIDRRVTQKRLADYCGVSLSTVRRAMQKFYELGIFIVEEPAAGPRPPLLLVNYMECEDFLGRWLGDAL
jgi:hypothetical protein